MSYGYFAGVYDILTENVDYEKIADRIDTLFPQGIKENGHLLDLGCGTGTLSFLLEEKGFDVIGIDKSEDMLSEAFAKKSEVNSNTMFLCQDLTELDLFGTAAGAVCVLDTVNHIESKEKICEFFRRVSLFLEMNCMFLLDINTPYKHREILSDNTFVYDADDVYCVWQNSYDEENHRTDIDLDFFIKDGDVYFKKSESFSEYEYGINDIILSLEQNGFTVLKQFDGYGENEPNGKTERVVLLAQKTNLVSEGEIK